MSAPATALHPQQPPAKQRQQAAASGLRASSTVCPRAARAGSLCSTSLPHCVYAGGLIDPACMVSGSLASDTQLSYGLGYAIQFAPRPPKFRGIHFTSVKAVNAHVLRAQITVLLAKDAIELVPPANMKTGFYSPYFIVPKKGGGLQLILDLCVLNRALHRLPFKMLTQKRIFGCIRHS